MIQVESLVKEYRAGGGRIRVLDDVSFSLAAGGSMSITGASGSGKTTLLGLCAGLDRPTSGHVVIGGALLNDLSEDELARLRNREIGFIFQNFQLIPTLTALENVMVPLELRGDKSAHAAAKGLLRRVGIGARLHHYPAQLSGGEQQRAAIARAFANRPKILFADEPTGNLDGETGRSIENLMFEINKEQGTVLVIVTHDNDLAAKTDQILRLKGGRLARA